MIRHCAKPAPDTMKACAEDFRAIKPGLRDDLDMLGMDVADQPSKVPCRILPAPRLRYKSRAAEIRDGQWRPDEFRFVKQPLEVYEGNQIDIPFSLVLLYFSVYVFGDPNAPRDAEGTLMGFMGNLVRQAQKIGFPMANKAYNMNYIRINNERDMKLFFEDRFKAHEQERRRLNNPNHKLQLIICCMPRKDSKMYSIIKFYAGEKFIYSVLVTSMKI